VKWEVVVPRFLTELAVGVIQSLLLRWVLSKIGIEVGYWVSFIFVFVLAWIVSYWSKFDD
jgi:hypothetical protein